MKEYNRRVCDTQTTCIAWCESLLFVLMEDRLPRPPLPGVAEYSEF